MTYHDLNKAFDEFSPTPEQEQAMLDRLLTDQKEVKPMNRMKKMTAVIAAAALLLMACAFTVATGLDQRIVEYFKGEPKDASLMSAGIVSVEQSHTYDNGWTVDIQQVLMDRNSIAALVEITAPDGIVPDPTYRILDMHSTVFDIHGEKIAMGGTPGWVSLEDDNLHDNKATMLWTLDLIASEKELWGKNISLTPGQFFWSKEEEPVQFSDEWSYSGMLPVGDSGLLYQMDAPFSLKLEELELKNVYISPIRFVLTLDASILDSSDPATMATFYDTLYEEGVFLTLEDGNIMEMRKGICSSSMDEKGDCRILFQPEGLVDPQTVCSVNLYGQSFSLDNLQPVGD